MEPAFGPALRFGRQKDGRHEPTITRQIFDRSGGYYEYSMSQKRFERVPEINERNKLTHDLSELRGSKSMIAKRWGVSTIEPGSASVRDAELIQRAKTIYG